MLKKSQQPAGAGDAKTDKHRAGNIQRRFIFGVLAPPFLVMLILAIIAFDQVNTFVRNQAVNGLNTAATTTAAKIEREFALRQTILKRTGEELFTSKNDYQASRRKLDADRPACSAHLKQNNTFIGAPNGVCDSFLAEFARLGPRQNAIEEGYVKQGEALIKNQNQMINSRLAAYKQFFPETVALVVVDKDQQVVSSALSNVLNGSIKNFLQDAADAQKQPVQGKLQTTAGIKLAVFAYPIPNGSVLAAYDVNSENFIKETWQSTPIDRVSALAIILDANGQLAYPAVNIDQEFKAIDGKLRTKPYTEFSLKKVDHIAVGAEAGSSKWLTVVATPKSAVLGPVHDAQFIAVLVIGSVLVGFLWVGAFFIRRTVKSIMMLVSGALVFAAGKLDYTIKLPSADEEFTRLADTMNMMAGRIAQAEKEIDEKNKEFISIATHELRTPLTSIIGNLSMVREDMASKLDPAVKSLVEQIYGSTTRLRDLVNDMLDVARLEGGRAEFMIGTQNIKNLATGVVENLQVTAKENKITLEYNDEKARNVLADEVRLRIVLNNFVSNAIKYNRPAGKVSIYHKLKGNLLVTAVEDTGLGIPDDQKPQMFEKFFRVDHQDRKNVVGTGLGMYITRQYVIAMGGDVWFESTHGKGTTFYFSLPLATSPKPESPLMTPPKAKKE